MWNFEEWWARYLEWYAREAAVLDIIGPLISKDWAKRIVRKDEDFGMTQRMWEKEQHGRALRPAGPLPPKLSPFAVSGYEQLEGVLTRAYNQAAVTKGAERHANDKPFHEQPMQAIADRRGIGFILGQVDKKTEEAQGMIDRGENDKAVHELLGAIVYLAGAIIFLEK